MTAQNDREIWVYCDTLYTPLQRLTDCALHIIDGKIGRILSKNEIPQIPKQQLVHEPGAIVAPGFIDLHVHGAGGCDVMDGTLESLQTVAATLARYGTTSFLATTLSAPDSDTEIAIRGFAAHQDKILDGARPIGIHMEGPFLNPIRRGTHNASYLRTADVQAFRRFVALSRGTIRKVTVAPEMDPGLELIRDAVSHGIEVSLGHSDATADQTLAAVDAGARHATHIFNAMRPFHQREPGILGQVLIDDRVYAEVISDGIHVHATALRLLLQTKGVGRILLVTDGLSAIDMPDGRYPLGDKAILVRNGECRDEDGALAGSTLTLDRAVRNFADWVPAPLETALAAASASPARSLGMRGKKGTIASGADADLVFLNSMLKVRRTMVAGRFVYSALW